MNSNSGMFQSLVRLRDLDFNPTGVLDVGAYEGHFSRGARKIFETAHILMIDALAEKGPVLADACRELGNADHLVAMLGDRETEATSFFVVNTGMRPDLVKTGSSKYPEKANFPMEERALPQRTLGTSSPIAACRSSYLSSMSRARNLMCFGAWETSCRRSKFILMEICSE